MSNHFQDKTLKKSILKIRKLRSRKLFLKCKSQNLINTVVRYLHKEKDVKKTVERKICKVRVF